MRHISRRDVLRSGAAATVLWLGPARAGSADLEPTPPQTRGPFYPDRLPVDSDNDLVAFADEAGRADGRITHVVGRVLDTTGRPVSDCRIEIWQCDANGRYHHVDDRAGGPRDPSFQGFGRFVTGPDGAYRFRTIRPVSYASRAPHIHFALTAPGLQPLVTQMYVEGEPRNATDWLLNSLQGPERSRLVVPLQPFPEGEAGSLIGRFDIVLADGR